MSFRGGLVSKVEGGNLDSVDSITNRVGVAIETRPDIELVSLNEDVSTSIASGSANTEFTHSPPAGNIDRLIAVRINVPATGNGSGDHTVALLYSSPLLNLLRGKSNFDAQIEFNVSEWRHADVESGPADGATALLGLQSVQVDENMTLQIDYANDTDAAVATTRNYRLIFARQNIA